MLRQSRLMFGSLVIVAVALVACSGDDDESDGGAASSTTMSQQATGAGDEDSTPTSTEQSPDAAEEEEASGAPQGLEDRLLRSSDLPSGYREEKFQRDEQSPCSPKNLGIPDAPVSAGIRFVPEDPSRATVDQLLEQRDDADGAFTKLVDALRDRCAEYAGGGFTEVDGPEVGDRTAWFEFVFGSDPSARVSGYFTLVVSDDVLGVLAVSWLGEDTDETLARDLVQTAGERLRS